MASRATRIATALAIAVALITPASAAVASSEPTTPAGNDATVTIPEGSTLVTVDELIAQGSPADQIAEQQAIWDSLPVDVYAEQVAQADAEHALFAEAFENVVVAPPVVPNPGGISPMIVKSDCTSGSYKIRSPQLQCFIGTAGTHVLASPVHSYGTPGTISVQAASYKGRVQYMVGNGTYWSTTRGPNDYTWYTFGSDVYDYDDHFQITRVQFI